eukprot:scaffold353744_cov59-Attheya_sp.AAC.1
MALDQTETDIDSTSNQGVMSEDAINKDAAESKADERDAAVFAKDATLPIPKIKTGSARGLKVLFLSSDTGGGHRASAESLAGQFELLYPGSTYDLVDVVSKDGVPPYNNLVSSYKHLSAHPSQWKFVYGLSNSRAFEMLADVHLKVTCERAVRRRIKSYDPDVVVSVHPLMTNVPVASCAKISQETGRHLPIFTVVTDLGSAHCLWFCNGVEKMFIASDQIRALAKSRGKVPDEKLVEAGLPIRHDFTVQAESLGERMSVEGKEYQRKVRANLELPYTDRKTVLVMGGGEGVGSLSNIVDGLYFEFVQRGIDAQILVVCGRNEILKKNLDERDWDAVLKKFRHSADDEEGFCYNGVIASASTAVGCVETGSLSNRLRRILSAGSMDRDEDAVLSEDAQDSPKIHEGKVDVTEPVEQPSESAPITSKGMILDRLPEFAGNPERPGKVTVVGLGFVKRMAEYMVASDVLVSKAGPGTIAEAASVSLPVMLTSFLPGQEEGNVDYVVDGKFGAFCSDVDPTGIADEVASWLLDEQKLTELSNAAKAKGAPYAARDIVKAIGDSTLKWRDINDAKDAAAAGHEREVAC